MYLGCRALCRALGLMKKLEIEPLWKIEKHIWNMSTHYQDLLSSFQLCVDDACAFVKGEKTFRDFTFANQDACCRKLITPEELIDMTKQVLKIIFSGLAAVTRQMVHDHVEDGNFANEGMTRNSSVKHNVLTPAMLRLNEILEC